MKVDVAIIGTGPGGGMAAYRLAKTDMKIAVLEKCKLPRPKACGGSIPAKAKSLFDWDIASHSEKEISSIKFFYNHSMPKEYHPTHPVLLMVDRSSFDYDLIKRALSLGSRNIKLIEDFNVVRVEENKNCVRIYGSNKEVIKSDFVIAADGPFSKTARTLGLNRNISCGLAMDSRVEVPLKLFESQKESATFNFFCLPKGFGWIFPKNGYFSCGVTSWNQRIRPSLPKAMNAFLKKSFPSENIKIIRRTVHPIPLYSGKREIATQRVCLVGDAANMTEPIMGEGIRFALESAVLAADVVRCLAGGRSDSTVDPEAVSWETGGCRSYQKYIRHGIGAEFDILYRYARPVFLDAPEFFYRKFILEGRSYLAYFKQIAAELKNQKKIIE